MEPSQLRRTENPDLGPSAPRPFYGEAEKPQITLEEHCAQDPVCYRIDVPSETEREKQHATNDGLKDCGPDWALPVPRHVPSPLGT